MLKFANLKYELAKLLALTVKLPLKVNLGKEQFNPSWVALP